MTEERIDTTYGDIAEFGGEGPETRRINVEGVHPRGMTMVNTVNVLDHVIWKNAADD